MNASDFVCAKCKFHRAFLTVIQRCIKPLDSLDIRFGRRCIGVALLVKHSKLKSRWAPQAKQDVEQVRVVLPSGRCTSSQHDPCDMPECCLHTTQVGSDQRNWKVHDVGAHSPIKSAAVGQF